MSWVIDFDTFSGKAQVRRAMLSCDSSYCIFFSDPDVHIPSDFPFPFEPYNIQKGFMREVYRCLELRKVGIFESPTGTVCQLGTCLKTKMIEGLLTELRIKNEK